MIETNYQWVNGKYKNLKEKKGNLKKKIENFYNEEQQGQIIFTFQNLDI